MSDNKWWQDNWGDMKGWVLGVLIGMGIILVVAVVVGIIFAVNYMVTGCTVSKGHIGPHISDGCYEYQITDMTFPRSENATFYLRGVITGKAGRECAIRADNSPGEQAWSQNTGGYITARSKNNHITKHHSGRKKPNEPR